MFLATYDKVKSQWDANYIIVVEDKRTNSIVAALNAVVDKRFNHQMEWIMTAMDVLIVERHQTSAMVNT